MTQQWKLIRVNAAFDDLMYWLERCERKGHLENCSDLVEPWEAFKYEYVEETPPASAQDDAKDEDSIALDKLAAYIADSWPDKKYGLEEICQRLHAMWPGEFIPLEDLKKNEPNAREALRALLTHWKRFEASDGNQQDAYNLLVKTARFAWQFAEAEVNRVPVASPAAGDARTPALNIEAAAKAMAECMDYPWEHMPEKGRTAMRIFAQSVIRAASQQQEG